MNRVAQFAFQNDQIRGRVLNVGCSDDPAGLGDRGAVNLDLHAVNPATGRLTKAHVRADARALPFRPAFDTVVLGDILEHLPGQQAVQTLEEARRVLSPGGRVVITCPNDRRTLAEQARLGTDAEYAPGCWSLHHRPMPAGLLLGLVYRAGLKPCLLEPIAYPHHGGWGVVAGVTDVPGNGEAVREAVCP